MSIGEALAKARGRTGMTINDVSERTRIRASIIRDIERDDFASCAGDFYARGHIRAIARVVDTDPAPLIEAYDHDHSWSAGTEILHPEAAAEAHSGTQPLPEAAPRPPPLRDPEPTLRPPQAVRITGGRPVNVTALLALGLVAAIGIIAYLFAGTSNGPTKAPAAAARSTPSAHPRHNRAAATPVSAPNPAAAAQPLAPARAVAFGPGGTSQGDNPQMASQALSGNRARAWHTSWYTTAEFGGLQDGTGLLLDMGREVMITSAQVTLGNVQGANVELRAGNVAVLADLQPVAYAGDAGGVLMMRPAHPARARYLLIWFTRLPPDNAGTFEAWISDVRLKGVT